MSQVQHESAPPSGVKSIQLEAVITRADGTVEPQGVVAYWHKNPLKRFAARLRGINGKVRMA